MLLIAHAARLIRGVNVAHAELMSALHGWPDPSGTAVPGYEVAHASMARSLARLEARKLIRRERRDRVQIALTRAGSSAASRLVRRLPDVSLPRAVHEAGHTVVALRLGLRVTGVHVVERYCRADGSAGETSVIPGRGDPIHDARNCILIAWGGACAEYVVLGASIDERIKYASAAQDFRDLTAIARKARVSREEIAQLRVQAVQIIREEKVRLKPLTVALQTHKMIGGLDAGVIFAGKRRRARPTL